MKKLFLIFSVYTATFFIGVSFVIFLHLVKTKMDVAETPKQAEPKLELVESPKEIATTPKIFAVKNFWDEFENQENKHLIETGEVSNGKDFKVKSGEIWLGFFGGVKKNTHLRKTKVSIKQCKDSDWKNINIKGEEMPLFLVKNLKNLKEGQIKTLFRGYTWREIDQNDTQLTLKKGFTKEFKLGGRNYTLRVEEGLSEENERILVLLLETETESQIIDYISYVGDGDYVGNLYWVGDLDSDGNLDLFMEFWNYEKGSYSSGLFLSSEAKKGQLVKRFEFLAYGGC